MDVFDGLDKASSALQKGGPYALLVLAFLVIVFLYRKRDEDNAARLADWQELKKTYDAATLASERWTAEAAARTKALEASVRSGELAASAQVSFANTVTPALTALKDEVAELKTETRQTRETLIRKGSI